MEVRVSKEEVKKILAWYAANARPLPWRNTKNPYKIWISEIMLQQTTAKAVIPFFERFIKKFPDLKSLAHAKLADVFELWAGLGYYSRAENIHKAAKLMSKNGVPKSYVDLIKLPGFGPYTSRAVSSFSYNELVGVVDGNVIRFFSRYYNQGFKWWLTKDKNILQKQADEWVTKGKTSTVNQALIEIGATICVKQNPYCQICPLQDSCLGKKGKATYTLPLKPQKRKKEIWTWEPLILKKQNKIAFILNNYSPFLKGKWILPGRAKKISVKPTNFDFIHNITHHEIYVKSKNVSNLKNFNKNTLTWIKVEDVSRQIPFSLIQKTLDRGLADKNNLKDYNT